MYVPQRTIHNGIDRKDRGGSDGERKKTRGRGREARKRTEKDSRQREREEGRRERTLQLTVWEEREGEPNTFRLINGDRRTNGQKQKEKGQGFV